MSAKKNVLNWVAGKPRRIFPIPLVQEDPDTRGFVSLYNAGDRSCSGECAVFDSEGNGKVGFTEFSIKPNERKRIYFGELVGSGSFQGSAVIYLLDDQPVWPYACYRFSNSLASTHLSSIETIRGDIWESLRSWNQSRRNLRKWSYMFLAGISAEKADILSIAVQNVGKMNRNRPISTQVRLIRNDGLEKSHPIEIAPDSSVYFRMNSYFPDAREFLKDHVASLAIPSVGFFLMAFHFNVGKEVTCGHLQWYRGMGKV